MAIIEVYTWEPNANSGKPLLCLHEKQVPFVHRYVDMGQREHHEPAFLAINPGGTVPALVHDGLVLTESTPMMEYIDDAFAGPPLRPADLWLRAEMRVWTKYVDEHFCPALTVLGAHNATAFASKIDKPEAARRLEAMPNAEVRRKWERVFESGYSDEELADARGRLARVAAKLERHLAQGGPWLLGTGYSLADIKWYSMVPGMPRLVPEICNPEATPAIACWLEQMAASPPVAALEQYRPALANNSG